MQAEVRLGADQSERVTTLPSLLWMGPRRYERCEANDVIGQMLDRKL